jgi:tetratricopeptide (TPR) repeat protein
MLIKKLWQKLSPPRAQAPAETWITETLQAWRRADPYPAYPDALLLAHPARARLAALLVLGKEWEEISFWIAELPSAGEQPVDRLLAAEARLFHGVEEEQARQALLEVAQAEGELAAEGQGALAARAATLLGLRLWPHGEMERVRELARQAEPYAAQAAGSSILLGALRESEGAREEALALYRQAYQLSPQSADAIGSLGDALIARGQWSEGFALWGELERKYGLIVPNQSCPLWQGEALGARRILAVSTMGQGDRLQMMRFGAWLRERHPQAVTATVMPPSLARIAQASGLFDEVYLEGTSGAFDCQTSYFDLPSRLDLPAGAPVWNGPYLTVTREDVQAAAAWLPARKPGVRRVGLCWFGTGPKIKPVRSIPHTALAPLFRVAGIEWIALTENAAMLEPVRGEPILDVSSHLTDFYATATLMHNLDLVVSVDTSVAHLAGGLGVPAWVLTRPDPEWRWGSAGARTPWYGTVRVVRHPRAEFDWDQVVQATARALDIWVREGGDVLDDPAIEAARTL